MVYFVNFRGRFPFNWVECTRRFRSIAGVLTTYRNQNDTRTTRQSYQFYRAREQSAMRARSLAWTEFLVYFFATTCVFIQFRLLDSVPFNRTLLAQHKSHTGKYIIRQTAFRRKCLAYEASTAAHERKQLWILCNKVSHSGHAFCCVESARFTLRLSLSLSLDSASISLCSPVQRTLREREWTRASAGSTSHPHRNSEFEFNKVSFGGNKTKWNETLHS